MVGVNPTRRGAELATDIRHTDCQLLVTERKLLPLLDGLDLGIATDRILVVDTDEYAEECDRYRDAPFPDAPSPDAPALLVFTSGHIGRAEGRDRVAAPARPLRPHVVGEPGADRRVGLLPRHADVPLERAVRRLVTRAVRGCDDRAAPPLLGVAVPPRRPPVPRHVLQLRRQAAQLHPRHATASRRPRPHTRASSGTRRSQHDIVRFRERFGVQVVDNYGSTEGGVTVMRSADQPEGALGRLPDGALVVDPESGTPRAAAQFDDAGRLVNAHECIGEIVNTAPGSFEGYYKNDEAVASARATAGTGRATSATSTPTDGCGSRAATTTGCASTVRTSPPRPSNASSAGSPVSCLPRSSRCRRPTWATRSWRRSSSRPASSSTRARSTSSWPASPTSA